MSYFLWLPLLSPLIPSSKDHITYQHLDTLRSNMPYLIAFPAMPPAYAQPRQPSAVLVPTTLTAARSSRHRCPMGVRTMDSTTAKQEFTRSDTGLACCTPSKEDVKSQVTSLPTRLPRSRHHRTVGAPLVASHAPTSLATTPFTITWTILAGEPSFNQPSPLQRRVMRDHNLHIS